jgi:hypothetical protein
MEPVLILLIVLGILVLGCFALVGAGALCNPVARQAIFCGKKIK